MNKSGIILLNKPRGLSSNTAVNVVKKSVGALKAGHLGTLDVEAEGLLPITLNSSTKLFDIFLNKDKTYRTKIKFGEYSPTYDLEGEIKKIDEVVIDKKVLKSVLKHFIGSFDQIPPNYSAKKINGKKAYQLALEGKDVELKPKRITIYDIKVVKQLANDFFELEISCSAGTYIRALARDIAKEFSTCGVCYEIIRTRCGNFKLKNSKFLEEIKKGHYNLIKPEKLFNFHKIKVTENEMNKLLNGADIKTLKNDGTFKVFHKNQFLGLGEIKNRILHLSLRLN